MKLCKHTQTHRIEEIFFKKIAKASGFEEWDPTVATLEQNCRNQILKDQARAQGLTWSVHLLLGSSSSSTEDLLTENEMVYTSQLNFSLKGKGIKSKLLRFFLDEPHQLLLWGWFIPSFVFAKRKITMIIFSHFYAYNSEINLPFLQTYNQVFFLSLKMTFRKKNYV